ncbi:hypothetical protein SCHPADRAFT_895820 [Schizopora paradoxa]|uniref:Uncharacterized protein n=1 Tax=Schizopora paradoxa TaxID=27342 RepID=A0A0H2RME9_9AGAM|nr:hypothetical protein SCHPADRAFT_895820 [Schizopora paradoxa]
MVSGSPRSLSRFKLQSTGFRSSIAVETETQQRIGISWLHVTGQRAVFIKTSIRTYAKNNLKLGRKAPLSSANGPPFTCGRTDLLLQKSVELNAFSLDRESVPADLVPQFYHFGTSHLFLTSAPNWRLCISVRNHCSSLLNVNIAPLAFDDPPVTQEVVQCLCPVTGPRPGDLN